jgi:hypothetical protein
VFLPACGFANLCFFDYFYHGKFVLRLIPCKRWRISAMSASRHRLYDKTIIFIGLFLYSFQPVLFARAGKNIAITSFTGGSITLIRNNSEYLIYNPYDIPSGGIALQSSDIIQTPPGVFVEVRLGPGKASVQIAENSSMIVENIVNFGNLLVFSFVYGRIRVVQDGKAGSIFIKTGQSLVELQNGSVSLDYTLIPGMPNKSPPVLYVSAMSGTAVFIPSVLSPFVERINLKKKEMLVFYTADGRQEKRAMDKKITEYWSKKAKTKSKSVPVMIHPAENRKTGAQTSIPAIPHPEVSPRPEKAPDPGVSPRPEKAPNPGVAPRPEEAPKLEEITKPEESKILVLDSFVSPSEQSAFLKSQGLITGLIFILSGVLVQNVVHYTYDDWSNSNIADLTYNAAYLPIGVGAFILLASFFYPITR